MSTTQWHVPGGLLDDYRSGRLDPALVMSVEAHLTACARCRALPVDEGWLAGSWDRVVAAVASPRVTLVERGLRRCGVPEHLARLLAAAPSLSRSWLVAVAVVLGFAVLFAYATAGTLPDPARLLPFLLVAPVLPVAGVAVAYGRWVDPAYETLAATPLAGGGRLLLLRASAVLVVVLVPAALAGVLLPGPWPLGVAWLLPGLGLTTACLALATRLPVPLAAGALIGAWFAVTLAAGGLTGDRLAPFGPAVQVGYAVAAAGLAITVYIRRQHLDPGAPRWSLLSGSAH